MPINHNKKRLLCFVLFLMAFIGLTCCKTVVAKDIGDDEKVYNKDWIYLENKNSIYIDRYIGKAEKVIIPSKINGKKVVGIGDEAFHNNKIIKSVDIPETVKEILDCAFFSCSKLKTIRFPKKNVWIGDSAFANCAIETLSINKNMTLGDGVFAGCAKLKKVIIRNGVKRLGGEEIFNGCQNLTTLILPQSLKEGVNNYQFLGCQKLKTISVSKKNASYAIYGGMLFNKALTELILCPPATKKNTVKLPDSVKKIAPYGFYNCKKIAEIDLNKVEEIGEFAFENCKSLNKLTIPKTINKIHPMFAENCSNIEIINIEANINAIGPLRGCKSLIRINISNDNDYLCSEEGIVYNKTRDTIVKYPCGLKTIKFDLPDSVISIGSYAFSECENLVSVNINKAESIMQYAFFRCSKIKKITLPDNITNINEYAFEECENLELFEVSNKNKMYSDIDGVLVNKKMNTLIKCPNNYKKENYIVPKKIKNISARAFISCKNIKSITMHSNVKSIDYIPIQIMIFAEKNTYAAKYAKKCRNKLKII